MSRSGTARRSPKGGAAICRSRRVCLVMNGNRLNVVEGLDLVGMRARGGEGRPVIGRVREGVRDMCLEQIQFEAIPVRPALGFQPRIPISGFAFGCLFEP